MLQRKVWDTYHRLYEVFGGEPVSVPRAMSRMRISRPSCKKMVRVLRLAGLLVPRGKDGREAMYEVVPPQRAGVLIALRRPLMRLRYVLDFSHALDRRVSPWYVTGVTALNYYLPYRSPAFEVATRFPREVRELAREYPYINVFAAEGRPGRSYEVLTPFATFRVASLEDALIKAYSSPPSVGVLALDEFAASIARRAAVTLAGRDRRFDVDLRRLEVELPPAAFKRLGAALSRPWKYGESPARPHEGYPANPLTGTMPMRLMAMLERVADDAITA